MSLEEALQAQEERVDALLKGATRYVSALKGWKKACQQGHISNMQKAAASAGELASGLPQATSETAESWDFDVRGYLENGQWRQELQTTASERFGLRVLEDDESLISSPVTVRAQPGRGTLALGKVNWPLIRPRVVAAELRRLRDRAAAANSQDFLESLLNAAIYLSSKEDPVAKFRDIYDLFCLTPGYRKENPPAAFGQQIYALHRSGLRTTRGGRKFEIEYATGKAKERDIFTVLSEDGRPLRYFNIWFK